MVTKFIYLLLIIILYWNSYLEIEGKPPILVTDKNLIHNSLKESPHETRLIRITAENSGRELLTDKTTVNSEKFTHKNIPRTKEPNLGEEYGVTDKYETRKQDSIGTFVNTIGGSRNKLREKPTRGIKRITERSDLDREYITEKSIYDKEQIRGKFIYGNKRFMKKPIYPEEKITEEPVNYEEKLRGNNFYDEEQAMTKPVHGKKLFRGKPINGNEKITKKLIYVNGLFTKKRIYAEEQITGKPTNSEEKITEKPIYGTKKTIYGEEQITGKATYSEKKITENPIHGTKKPIHGKEQITEKTIIGKERITRSPTTTQKRKGPRTRLNFKSNVTLLVRYLRRFGHLKGNSSILSLDHDSSVLQLGIKRIQKLAGLNQTGIVDNATDELLNTPRCHLTDENLYNKSRLVRRYVFAGNNWLTNTLTYSLENSPSNSNMDSDTLNEQIATAFRDWTQVSDLHINPVSTASSEEAPADLNVKFSKYDHSDGLPFDGPLGIVAHGFFPLDGRLHFDDSEIWSANVVPTGNQINLRQVATHEIGHILGLAHTSTLGAVMYPYYSFKTSFSLQSDDIEGIQALYGKPNSVPLTNDNNPIINTVNIVTPTAVITTNQKTGNLWCMYFGWDC